MPYAQGRTFLDADSHIMELPNFLREPADPGIRDRIPELAIDGGDVLRDRLSAIDERGGHSPETVSELLAQGDGLIAGPKGLRRARGLRHGGAQPSPRSAGLPASVGVRELQHAPHLPVDPRPGGARGLCRGPQPGDGGLLRPRPAALGCRREVLQRKHGADHDRVSPSQRLAVLAFALVVPVLAAAEKKPGNEDYPVGYGGDFGDGIVGAGEDTTAELARGGGVACSDCAPWEIEALVPGSPFHGIHGLVVGPDGAVFAGDVIGQTLFRIDPESGAVSVEVPPPFGEADDVAIGPDGTMAWTAIFAGEVRARRPDGSEVVLARGVPGFNSLAFAPDGRLFATTVLLGDALYEIDLDGADPPRKIVEGMGWLNGFDFGPDGALYGPLVRKGSVARVDVESGTLEIVATGFELPVAANFDSQGVLHVLDTVPGEVHAVDIATGAGRLVATVSPALDNLAFGADGRLFVTNMAENSLYEVDTGSGSSRLVTRGALSTAGGLALGDTGGRPTLFVPNIYAFHATDLETGETREVDRMFGGEIQFPLHAAAHGGRVALGSMVFPGFGDASVQLYDPVQRRVLETIAGFEEPQGLLFLDAATLLVAEFRAGALVEVTLGAGGERRVVAQGFDGPLGLAPDLDRGGVYVTEQRRGAVVHLDLDTGERRDVATGLVSPEGIDPFTDGRLAVAEVGRQRLLRIDPASGHIEVLRDELPIGMPLAPLLPESGLPTGVAVGDDDSVYLSSDADTAVYRLRPPR